jgi:predicted transcriptional regulator of viral defense system
MRGDCNGYNIPLYCESRRVNVRHSLTARIVPRSAGINAAKRTELETLHRSFGTPFTVVEASQVLGIEPKVASRELGYLSRRGWLTRVRRGLYLPVPLEAPRSGEWIEDPWIVAAKAFSPCYIGGWSACEEWGLTEQIFRDVVVVTAHEVRRRHQELQGFPYLVTRRPEAKLFGTRWVWRRTVRVPISDPSRTIIDILDDTSLGGGIRHVFAVVREYLRSDERNDKLPIEYGDRLGNRAVFKRLGWILEVLGVEGPLYEACRERRSAGLSKLDPTVTGSGRIVRRWNLRVNVDLHARDDT